MRSFIESLEGPGPTFNQIWFFLYPAVLYREPRRARAQIWPSLALSVLSAPLQRASKGPGPDLASPRHPAQPGPDLQKFSQQIKGSAFFFGSAGFASGVELKTFFFGSALSKDQKKWRRLASPSPRVLSPLATSRRGAVEGEKRSAERRPVSALSKTSVSAGPRSAFCGKRAARRGLAAERRPVSALSKTSGSAGPRFASRGKRAARRGLAAE